MSANNRNRLKTTISAVASSGLGAFTISTASSGYRSFVAGDDGLTFDGVLITEGTTWEVRDGCVYTHSGTSLSRGTLMDSSTGSAIAFTSAAVVSQGGAKMFADMALLAMASTIPGGRLTLESGVPVSTTDQTAKTSIYYTPFVNNVVPLWDGYKWRPIEFSETTLALGTLTSGKPYDVFGYISGGALALESLAWTDDTTRATAVTLQDGRYCKDGDKTRLLLGTFYTTSTTTTEDSQTRRFLSNIYNGVARSMRVSGSTSHSYNGGYRYWNNDSSLRLAMVVSSPSGTPVLCGCSGEGAATAGRYMITAQKLDGNTAPDGVPAYFYAAAGGIGGTVLHKVATGYHYIAAVESTASLGASDFNSIYLAGAVLG